MDRRPTLALSAATLVAALFLTNAPELAAELPPTSPAPVALASNDAAACLRCHAMPNFGFRESVGLPPRHLSVPADSFATGAHGKLTCQSCHPDVRTFPHQPRALRRTVSCADDCHATDTAGRPYTHRAVVSTFAASAHRRGLDRSNRDAPTCLSCHGGDAHTVRPARAKLSLGEKMSLCVDCHDDEQKMRRNDVATNAVASYRRSFHYKAIRFGDTTTAVCQDCHTVHGVLPADSARSSIARGNVATTCGRSGCHPGAQMNFAMSGANHLDLRIDESPILWIEERFFLALTGGTMAMLVVGIALDVQRRFGWRSLLARWARAIGALARRWAAPARDTAYAGGRWLKKVLID